MVTLDSKVTSIPNLTIDTNLTAVSTQGVPHIKLILLLLALFGTQLSARAEQITLIDTQGRSLHGTVLEVKDDTVSFRRSSDGRTFDITLSTLDTNSQEAAQAQIVSQKPEEADPASLLKPGEIFTLEFPELGVMAKGKPAKCEVSLPKNYSPKKVYPLLVWFGGGKGSHQVKGAKGIVDFDQFIVAAIPYPEGRLPRLGVENGDIDDFWDFQKPILEKIQATVPNISESVRIAGGFSSGGHLVGSALDLKWKGFSNYFTAYILHEGGTSPNMTYKGLRSSHKVLVTYGEESPSREWQNYFMKKMEAAHSRTDFIGFPNCKHALPANARATIQAWIEKELLPKLER